MESISPFPHHQPTASANFQVYSSVQSSSTSRSRKAKHVNLTPSSTRRLNRGSCHTPKYTLLVLKTCHTSMLKDSSRVDQTNSLLDNQPKLGFGNSQIHMDFQHLQWSSCLIICFKESPCQVSSFTSQVPSDNCSDG